MAEYRLHRELTVGSPIEQVFKFFSNAANLELITPPELNFQIRTPQPIEIRKGALIEYKIRMYGFPLTWVTEITEWDPPNRFVDTQLRGPYSQWHHTHTFTEVSPGTVLIEDDVRYRLPFEPVGDIAHFMIERQLGRIFDYRQKKVGEVFTSEITDQPKGNSPE